ncbi:MAG: molybdopterin oxidoreductase, partial [Proteobacteria bacterium]|nr:molybdopterin oxidoreductase [Pseudomonadota bacterium]
AAAAREIGPGDWVIIETPKGRVRARARINEALDPQVVCGQHGWWQACPEIGAPGFEPFGPDSANFNLLIGHDDTDPVSGSVPLRAYICEIKRLL